MDMDTTCDLCIDLKLAKRTKLKKPKLNNNRKYSLNLNTFKFIT